MGVNRAIVLVGNRKDGAKGVAYDRACDVMRRRGLEIVEMVPLTELDRLDSWVQEPDASRPLIVAAGGDGTIGSVANYLVNSNAVLGIIPLGTSNDVARSLQIPLEVEGAVNLLTNGKAVTIDVREFTAQGEKRRIFVHAAAIGLNVQFARLATRKSMRARLGPFTYVVAGILAFRHFDPFTLELEYENERETLCLLHLSVVNAPVFGGILSFRVPGSHVSDRRLDLLAVESMSVRRLLSDLMRVLVGRGHAPVGLRVVHVRHVRIHAETPLAVTIDGEIAGRVPGDFRLAAQALRVITPRNFSDSGEEADARGELAWD